MKRLLFVILLISVFSYSFACYDVYNISVSGELGENDVFNIKLPNVTNINTNCQIENNTLFCNGRDFYFYAESVPYSAPVVIEEYSYP